MDTNCLTCESTNHRSHESGSGKCLCTDGYYDDTSNELCGTCHYSWFLKLYI